MLLGCGQEIALLAGQINVATHRLFKLIAEFDYRKGGSAVAPLQERQREETLAARQARDAEAPRDAGECDSAESFTAWRWTGCCGAMPRDDRSFGYRMANLYTTVR